MQKIVRMDVWMFVTLSSKITERIYSKLYSNIAQTLEITLDDFSQRYPIVNTSGAKLDAQNPSKAHLCLILTEAERLTQKKMIF